MKPFRPLIALLLTVSLAQAAEVRTLSGETHKGDIVSLTDKEVKITVEGKEVTLPLADLLAIDWQAAGKPVANLNYVRVKLMDGSTLKCQTVGFVGKNASLRLLSGTAVQVPAAAIHHVLFEAQDEKNRTEFEQLLAKKLNQDVLRVASRDGSTINTFEGFVGDADAKGETIHFKTGGNAVDVGLPRVRGVIFSRKAEETHASLCKLTDTFDNQLVVQKLSPTQTGFKLTTPVGLEIDLDKALVVRLDFSSGKVVYLSDLEPASVDEAAILADLWHYRRDKNLEGGPLRLGQKTYTKGLAVHSRTILVYEVKDYNAFRCVLGIDDLVTGPAHALVRIEGDGKRLFEAAVTSKDKPQEVDLKITGVTRLRLIVDYGDDLDLGDHVDFADARVTK